MKSRRLPPRQSDRCVYVWGVRGFLTYVSVPDADPMSDALSPACLFLLPHRDPLRPPRKPPARHHIIPMSLVADVARGELARRCELLQHTKACLQHHTIPYFRKAHVRVLGQLVTGMIKLSLKDVAILTDVLRYVRRAHRTRVKGLRQTRLATNACAYHRNALLAQSSLAMAASRFARVLALAADINAAVVALTNAEPTSGGVVLQIAAVAPNPGALAAGKRVAIPALQTTIADATRHARHFFNFFTTRHS